MINNKDLVKRQVQELLESQPHRYFKVKEIARLLTIAPRDYSDLRVLLRGMLTEDEIAKYKSNRYVAKKPRSTVEGKIEIKSQGYGFLLTPAGQEDIFIGPKNLGLALDADVVQVEVFAASKKKRRVEGRVVKVIERGRQHIVGTLKKGNHFFCLVPDDHSIHRDIYIHESDLNGAKEGQKVAVEIDYWDDEWMNPEGHVAAILGFPSDPGVDVLSVVAAYNLPLTFPKQVEAEVTNLDDFSKKDIKGRLDFRKEMCFTIDPPDAKDFDDAVSCKRLDNGNFELGVHIADVSHFVTPGSQVDKEAFKRGTSVYLVDRVIPMLPEKLSNTLCSLQPNKDRLAYSCIMEVTPAGAVVRYAVRDTVIRSKRRFSYQEVYGYFSNEMNLDASFAEPLNDMRSLAKTLRRNRFRDGSLRFETPEPKVKLDKRGKPLEIYAQKSLESMQMIEEFMLLANKTIAEFVDSLGTDESPPPFVYRNHDRPATDKMLEFIEFVNAIGLEHGLRGKITSKKLSQFMATLEGTQKEKNVTNILLRSLMKARYESGNIGHFGLAFKKYTHFTSPIRRYPDLIVHRLLKQYLKHGFKEEQREHTLKHVDKACKQSNDREIVAVEAERTSIKMKQIEYMSRHVGDDFDGRIAGVVHFGIFVEIGNFMVEGLVHLSDLGEDIYEFDDKTYTLFGTTTGKVFRLGDHVKVKVVRADLDELVIDLVLAEPEENGHVNQKKTNKKRKNSNHVRKNHNTTKKKG